jgi:pimeloyl-ACP methyl ester carboxylesterase
VLTPSFLCDGTLFEPQVEALQDDYRVITVDLRGHGRSDPSPGPFTVYDLVEDVAAVLDAEDVSSAVWAGLSIGGFLSLRAALVRPERVSALVLMDTDAGAETRWKTVKYRAMEWAWRTLGPRSVVSAVMPLMFGKSTFASQPGLVEDYRERFMKLGVETIRPGLDAITGRDDLGARLGEITVPTLVIVGEEDRTLPPANARRMARGIPGAELVIVPGAGHLASSENPEPVHAPVVIDLDG